AILEKNRRNNREDRRASSRHLHALEGDSSLKAPVLSIGGVKYLEIEMLGVYLFKKKFDVFEAKRNQKAVHNNIYSLTEWSGRADENNLFRKSKRNLKTPMEMSTGKAVNYSDFHISGSRVKGVSLVGSYCPQSSRQLNDSSDKVVPQHESNIAYCLLTEEEGGEPSTLQEAQNNPDASLWMAAMQE
ncbi:hypothetical protein Tco_1026571, partial [Tanacetum coccineum]